MDREVNGPERTEGGEMTIGPIEAEVHAPAPLVYQMLAAIGQGVSREGERAEILEASGDRLVCDFWTVVPLPVGGARLVRTREVVTLRPPDTVEYRHLDGPLRDLRETIVAREIDPGRTLLVYTGVYRPPSVLHRLGFRLARGLVKRTMERHFADLRNRAEARAARSRLFPRPAGSPARNDG